MRFSKIENEPKATPSPESWGKDYIGSFLLLTKFSFAESVSFRGMHPRTPAVKQKDFAHCDGQPL